MYATSYQNRSERVAKEQVHILQKSKDGLISAFCFLEVFFGKSRNQIPNVTTISEQFTTMIYLVTFISLVKRRSC